MSHRSFICAHVSSLCRTSGPQSEGSWRRNSSRSSCPPSETGRIRFRRVRFQTPNSVSFSGLTEFRGANSVSSFQPINCVSKRTHRVFSQNSPSLTQNSVRLSEFSPPKQYSRNSIPPVSCPPLLIIHTIPKRFLSYKTRQRLQHEWFERV